MALATERVNVIFDADASPVIAAIRKVTAEAKQFQNAIGGMEDSEKNLLLATVGDTLIGAAKRYLGVLLEVGKATSNLIEQTNFAQKVFGDAFEGVEKFADSAAKIGFSKTSALNAAAALGVFGKTAGLAGEELVGFTEQMVTMAADMASVRNTTPEEAIIALGAAMRSEYEPLRRFGVVLNDVQLRQRAWTLGIYDGTGALNSSQRILAARAEVMEQLGFATGDFIDTQDQFANSQRVLNAEMENFKAAVGQGVLPLMLGLTKVANALLGAFNSLPDALQATIGGLALLAGVAVGALGALAKLVSILNTLKTISAFEGISTALAASLPAAAAIGIAAIAGIGIAMADAKSKADDASDAVDRFNKTVEATRGNTEDAVQLDVRGMVDDQGVTDSFDQMGLSITNFRDEAVVAIQGTEDQFAEFTGKWSKFIADALNQHPELLGSTVQDDMRLAIQGIENVNKAYDTWMKDKAQKDAQDKKETEAATAEQIKAYQELIKTYESAAKAKSAAEKALREAKKDLAETQTKALADFAAAQEAYNKSIADQERSIERQRQSTEEAYAAIADAQRGVLQAIRAETKARENIQRAIRDQADAAGGLVEAQRDAADAQEEFADASREVEQILHGYGAASQQAADAFENLDDAQRKVRASQLGLEDSTLALTDAQTELDRLRRFYGGTSSPSALRRLADAERAVERAKLDHAEATDALDDSTKDANQAQKDYNYTVNGFPRESDLAQQAMDRQQGAARSLEGALKAVENANRRVVDAQRAVDEAYYAADEAAYAVEQAQYRVEAATRSAQYASDDLRRAEWELATYRQSGQPQMAMESIRAHEDAIRDARAQLVAETWALNDAEAALAAARAATPAVYNPRTSPIYTAPNPGGFMNGYAPAGTTGTARIDVNVTGAIMTPEAARTLSDALIKFWRSNSYLPEWGKFW